MQITFAGTIIAREFSDGGTDAVDGFLPKRTPNLQWGEALRGTDAAPLAGRANRKRSLAGTITLQPFADEGSALQAALLYLDDLPDVGGLIIRESGRETTFDSASIDYSIKRHGVTVTASITFSVGPGKDTTTSAITDESGTDIIDQTGAPITDS